METKSNSEANQTSATSTYDQRVAADNSAIAIGAGGSYVNTISEGVVNLASNFFSKVLDFSTGVLHSGADIVTQSQSNSSLATQGLIASNQQLKTQEQLGNAGLLTQLFPILTIGAIGIVIFLTLGKRR